LSVIGNPLVWKNYYSEWDNAMKSTLTIEEVLPKLKKYKDGTEELPEVAEND